MDRSFATHRVPRVGSRRLAYASALAGLALAGSVGLGLPYTTVRAQLKPEAAPGAGRAPASFADIVERVKPAVVSIQVTNGQPKLAQNPKGNPKGLNPARLPARPAR